MAFVMLQVHSRICSTQTIFLSGVFLNNNMEQEVKKNIKVGIIVISGLFFLIIALYTIGNRKNYFGSNFSLRARFNTVSGLIPGNQVRLSGISVGTVQNIDLINDSTVEVTMVIKDNVKKFINKNAVVSIGTD